MPCFYSYFSLSNLSIIDGSVVQQSRHYSLGNTSRRAFTPDAPRVSRMRDLSHQVPNPQPLTFDHTTTEPGSPPLTKPIPDEDGSSTSSSNTRGPLVDSNQTHDQSLPTATSHDQENDQPIPSPPRSVHSDNSKNDKSQTSSPETSNKLSNNKESVSTIKSSPNITQRESETVPSSDGSPSLAIIEDIDRNMSVTFRQELLSVVETKIDSKIGIEVSKLADPDLNVIELFGRCLPDIVPNVILAKRDVRVMQ